MKAPASPKSIRDVAKRLRIWSLKMTTEAGSGHPTTCLSCAEIMAALFFGEMRWDPSRPERNDADLFVLSKGHAAPILYAALYEAGAIRDDPLSLRKFGSALEGHPTPNCPWVRLATGSLGQGLSMACGMAYAKKLDGLSGHVFCLLGDGETAEGSVWEAAHFASHYKLSNLVAIVDVNGLAQSGPPAFGSDPAVYARRFEAFGWKAAVVDGHDLEALSAAFAEARSSDRPFAIAAKTAKGKGVSFLEGKDGWHGKPVPKERLAEALSELGEPGPQEERSASAARCLGDARREGILFPRRGGGRQGGREWAGWEPPYREGQEIATRQAYGEALARLGERLPSVVVLDGDVKNSTYAEIFAKKFPDRYVECYIAEQNMVGAGLGLAAMGKIPFVSSFAVFLTRAFDFIRMAAYSRPPHLVLCGSHTGTSIGEDGPSQMGLEDISMMRSVFGAAVLCPSDAVSADRLVQEAARTNGIVYLRTMRPRTPVIYPAKEKFPVGGSKTLRRSRRDRAAIVACGIAVHEALKAYELLRKKGIFVRVIDAYSIAPLDEKAIRAAAKETGRIIAVEDHCASGGLGEAVAGAVAGVAPVIHLAVREIPRSGRPEELLAAYKINAAAIAAAVRRAR